MTHIWKRSISMLLALVMVFGMLPTFAFAEEENFEEQSYVEEFVTEEPAAEEPAAEEPAAEEPVEEEPAAEESEEAPAAEETISIVEIASQYVADVFAMAVQADAEIDGYIWLNRHRSEGEIRSHVLKNGLSDMILAALGKDGWDVTFAYEYTYMGVSGKVDVSMDAPDVMNMSAEEMAAWTYLAEEIYGEGNVLFTITKGNSKETHVVGFRSVNSVNIKINAPKQVIEADTYADAVGSVETAKTVCKESVSISYTNQEGETEQIPVAVAKISFESVTEADWPEDSESNVVDPFMSVTIVDSMDGTDKKEVTASLTLKDTTPVYTVKYDLGNGNVVEAKPLAEGKTTPSYESIKGEAPAKTYYAFVEWQPAVADTIVAAENGVITYTAKWAPVNDVNGNGVADEEDLFKIVYKTSVDGEVIAEYEQHAGEKTKIPADPAGYTDGETEWQFVEWKPAPSETVAATPKNAPPTVYVAQWTADHRVHFLMHDNSKRVTTIETGKTVIEQEFTYKYKTSAGTWYYADAEGNYIDVDGRKAPVAYDFDTPVTGDLYLVAEWFEDRNENQTEDGTSFDPIHRHTWYGIDETTVVEEKLWVVGDLVTDADDLVCTYKEDGWYFEGWVVEPEADIEENGVLYIQHTYRPNNPVKDVNGNKINDALETIKVSVDAASAGKGTVTVKATNLVDLGGGTYIYDSRAGYEFCRNITIIAEPVVTDGISESYVSEIKVNGEVKTATYKNYIATCTYTVGAAVATVAEGKAAGGETIEVTFADAQLTLQSANVMQYIVGQTEVTEADVYNAAIAAPEYNANYVKSLKYLARAESEKEVSVDGIQKQIDDFALPKAAESMISAEKFEELKQKASDKLDELAPGGKYDIQLDAVWLNIDAKITEVSMEKVVDDAAKKVMNSVMSSVLEDVDYASKHMNEVMQDALDEFERTINVQATMADCHVFGRNTGADDVITEQLAVVYQDEKMHVAEENIPIRLQDKRVGTKITASDVEIYYGTEFDVLNHAKLTTTSGNPVQGLELDGDYSDLIPGNYTVYLKFAGNSEFKPSNGSYKLTIVGPTITLAVADKVISDDVAEIKAKAKPVIKNEKGEDVDFDSITGLHVVAGYDVTKADSLNFENNSLTVKAYAKVKMSAKLETLLSAAGVKKEEIVGSYDLQQFVDVLNNKLNVQLPGEIQTNLENVLTNLKMDKEDVKVQVDVCDDPYPENPGAYMNLVYAVEDGIVTVDGGNPVNGWIVYHPAVYIPDNGIELTYNGVGGHKLEIPSDAANKELQVMRGKTVLSAGEYSIYYVGITGDGASYMDSKAPTEDGIYFVGAVDLRAEKNRISTDCALVTIGLEQGKLVIDNLTKVEEKPGVNYVPDIEVNDGAAVTMVSGTVGVDVEELKELTGELTKEQMAKLIGCFYGSVHIEIPNALYSKMSAAWEEVAAKELVSGYVDMPAKMPAKAQPAHVLKVLKYLKETNNSVVDKTLGRIQRIEGYVEQVMGYVNASYDELIKIVELLHDDVTVTMNSKRQSYSAAGVYAYVGVVTDPTFIPDVDAGLLVIENGATFQLENETVPYDGNEHVLKLVDEVKQGSLMIIRQGDEFNFLLGDLETKVVEKIQELTGKTFADGKVRRVTVDELYAVGGDYAEKLAKILVDELAVRAEAQLKEKFGGRGVNALNSAMSTLKKRLIPAAENYLINKFKALDGLSGKEDAGIVIGGDLPVEVGEYQFYAISYGVAITDGTLIIEAAEIDKVVLDNYSLTYNGAEQSVNILEVWAGDVKLADGEYTVSADSVLKATEEGEYTVIVTGNGPRFKGTVKVTWTIEPADQGSIDVELVGGPLVYNATEQTQNVKVTFNGVELTEGTDYEVTGNKKTDAGDYTLTVTFKGNYSGTKELPWTIAKAEITSVTAEDFTYDGTEKKPVLTVKAGELDVPAEAYEVGGTPAATDAGSYIVIVAAKEDSNFTGSKIVTWTISAKEITVTVEDISISLGDPVPAIVPVVKDAEGNDITDAGITITITDADGNPIALEEAARKKGVYTITVTVGNKNYAVSVASDLEAIFTVTDYICWNPASGVFFEDVSYALDTVAGEIQMLKNATSENQKDEVVIIVGAEDTLDLNGFYVETDNLLSYGVVMDSQEKTGGIKIGFNQYVKLTKNNGDYFPVYDSLTDSYKFYKSTAEGAIKAHDTKGSNATLAKFRFRILFENLEAYQVIARTITANEDTGFKVINNMGWTGISGFGITYTMGDNWVKDHANTQYASNRGYAMTLNASGIDRISGGYISCEPTLVSKTGVTVVADTLTYDVP